MLDPAVSIFNPFPGLRAFEPEETHLFFGRDGQSDELLEILARNRFVAVVGTSGSGKSSLVKAGMLPALERGFLISAGSNWRMATMRPGANPIQNLASAIARLVPLKKDELDVDARQALVDATLRRTSFGLIEAAHLAQMDSRENLVILVDQFEEVFRVGAESSDPSAGFVRLLLEAVRQQELRIYVCITMRSDFLGDCARFRDLPETLNRAQYLIPRMTREQRRQAIEGPVAVGGATISPRLVQRLLNDVGDEPDQLPILQHALMRTWDAWQRAGDFEAPIDLEHYESIGGMAGALSRHADEAYAELDESGAEIARRMFERLAEKGPDNREIRRPTHLTEICAVAEAPIDEVARIVDRFRTDGRTFLRPPAPEMLGPDSIIDISHESLIRLWNRLRQWTDEETESAINYRRLADDAVRHKAGRAAFWRDPGLALALEWKEKRRPNAAWASRYAPGFGDAMDFLENSRRAREATTRLRRGLMVSMIALTVTAIMLAWVAYRNEDKAARANEQSLARQLIAEAQLIENDSPEQLDRGALLAIESAKRAHLLDNDRFLRHAAALLEQPVFTVKLASGVHGIAFSSDAKRLAAAAGDSLVVLEAGTGKVISYFKHGGSVNAIAFSPDGNYVATASDDKTARVFDLSTRRQVSQLAEDGAVLAVAFSPDGRQVATGSFDKTARVFEAATGKEVSRLIHDDVVGAVAFSPRGGLVATGSQDKTARVFDAATGKEISRLTHDSAVWALAFSPDGRLVATGSVDTTARLFEASTGKEKLRLGHGNIVDAVAFSPDGKFVATGSYDQSARMFDTATGTQTWIFPHGDIVTAVAFSPDGRFVVTGSKDKTARVVDAATGKEMWRFAHRDAVSAAAFAPDGNRVATGSDDEYARVFNIRKPTELSLVMQGGRKVPVAFGPDGRLVETVGTDKTAHLSDANTGEEISRLSANQQVLAVGFSADGRYIATGNKDGMVRVFETRTGKEVSHLKLDSIVDAVALSADGRFIATGSHDQTARVFELASGKEVSRLKHDSIVDAVTFSPDGRLVATGSYDQTARVFEAATGKEVSRLRHDSIVDAVAFSLDGRFVATGSKDKTARVFEVSTGKEVSRLTHGNLVTAVEFSPDGQLVATGSGDKTTRVFEATTGREVSRFPSDQPVVDVKFSRDGSHLHSASKTVEQSEVAIANYSLDVPDLVKDVCTRLKRNLTAQDWKQYLPYEHPEKTCANLP